MYRTELCLSRKQQDCVAVSSLGEHWDIHVTAGLELVERQ